MIYVIAEPCIGVKDKSCVAICPMDCIHEGMVEREGSTYDMLFIDPESCIGCGLCEPECPVGAIFIEDEVPDKWREYVLVNAEFYKSGRR
jgi:ferredoxin